MQTLVPGTSYSSRLFQFTATVCCYSSVCSSFLPCVAIAGLGVPATVPVYFRCVFRRRGAA
eukprot:6916475-Lingulodinium_polyedra.AAC.1